MTASCSTALLGRLPKGRPLVLAQRLGSHVLLPGSARRPAAALRLVIEPGGEEEQARW